MKYILAIDQGTTSSRAVLFDSTINIVDIAQQEIQQYYPQSGWVEHDAEEILQSVIDTCQQVLSRNAVSSAQLAGIGITNQRETTIVWDKNGKPVHRAIVWQDRRTSNMCDALKADNNESLVQQKTGLLLDPYFSASKLQWLLDTYDKQRTQAKKGNLLFGTVDSFLVWKLTNGAQHVTDATNAARTMLYNIHSGCWDDDMCRLFSIPTAMLPQVCDNAADFGNVAIGGISSAIFGIAGDQQAASLGQAAYKPGMVKSTYGTGCFALLHTGSEAVQSQNRLLTTIASRLDGNVQYALEGSLFVAGSVIQWLRDEMRVLAHAKECEAMAAQAKETVQLYLVPAFTGLGAPYWDAQCRGALYGLTRDSGRAELVKAALQSVAYQSCDLLKAMSSDWQNNTITRLRVDGGMAANNWLMQFLADMLDVSIERPEVLETTAVGAAWLAGMKCGLYPDMAQFSARYRQQRAFTPAMNADTRTQLYDGWQDAVARTLTA